MNTTAIPRKIRVVRLDEVGPPENLKLVEVSTPIRGLAPYDLIAFLIPL